jgi:proline dehydrogenase
MTPPTGTNRGSPAPSERGVASAAVPQRVASDPIEARTREIASAIRAAEPAAPMRDRASDGLLVGLEDREPLRAALFRFVDAAPACDGALDRGSHLRAYLREVPPAQLPRPLRALAAPRAGAALVPIAGALARPGIRLVARRFIAGRDVADAAPTLRRAWLRGEASALDLLGEATVTAAEADAYRDRCLEALRFLAERTADWPAHPTVAESDRHGPLPRANLSIKLTALTPLLHPHAPDRGASDAAARLRALLRRARECGAHLHLDTEDLDSRETLLRTIEALVAEPEFADGPSIGVVVQTYLRDADEVLERVLDSPLAARGMPLCVRLVKGAYWEHETAEAAKSSWRPPVWSTKRETDACFERVTRRLIDRADRARPEIASHNLRSVAYALAYAEHRGLDSGELELQVLRGLGDSLAVGLARAGHRVRVYTPVGDLVAGMAYLVRRLLENSSSQGFLVQRRRMSLDELLESPA